MSGFTKLFSSIVTSSVWCEDDQTRLVWITMLALCDADGMVEGSIPGFANVARVSVEAMRRAVDRLSAPDPESRTPDHEGRRIAIVPGGWRILNYAAKRAAGQGQRGSRADYYRDRRARLAGKAPETTPTAQPDRNIFNGCATTELVTQPSCNHESVARHTEADAVVVVSQEFQEEASAGENAGDSPAVLAARARATPPPRTLACPQCGNQDALAREKGRFVDSPTRGKGWRCDPREGGCGAIFDRDDPRVFERLTERARARIEAERGDERKAREAELEAHTALARQLEAERTGRPEFQAFVGLVERLLTQQAETPPAEPPAVAWGEVRARLERLLNPYSFATWFRPTESLGTLRDGDGERLLIVVPNDEFRTWLANNYRDAIDAVFKGLGWHELGLTLVTAAEVNAAREARSAAAGAA